MAINRADIYSRTFEIPQPEAPTIARGGAGSGAAAPKYDSEYFGVPKAAEGLQWTDNVSELSNRYYQKLSALDQYAKSMWLNNKIDVTKPDYANPQGVLAAQAYQQELANIMSLADELKESQKSLTKTSDLYNQGKYQYDPDAFAQGQTFANLTPEQQGYSLEVDPLLEFQQNGINRAFESGADYRTAQQAAQASQQAYGQQAATTGSQRDLRQSQAAQSLIPARNIPSPPAGGSGTGGAFGLINNANVLGGGDAFYTQTPELDENGKPIMKNATNDFIGIPLGGGFVTELKRANGKTFLVNDKGYDEEVRPDNIYKYLVMAAKKTGQERELEMEFKKLVDQGKVKWDKTQLTYTPVGLTVDELMSDLGKAEKNRLEESLPDYKGQVEAVKQDLNTKLTQVKEFNKKGWWDRADTGVLGWMGADVPKFKLQTNSPLKQVEISPAPYSKKEEDFIQLKVVDNAGTQLAHVPKGAKEAIPGIFKFKTIDEAINFMKKEFGIFDVGALIQEQTGQQPTASTSQTPVTGKSVSRQSIQSKVGTPGFEGYTEQELIDYYTSQGYTIK